MSYSIKKIPLVSWGILVSLTVTSWAEKPASYESKPPTVDVQRNPYFSTQTSRRNDRNESEVLPGPPIVLWDPIPDRHASPTTVEPFATLDLEALDWETNISDLPAFDSSPSPADDGQHQISVNQFRFIESTNAAIGSRRVNRRLSAATLVIFDN